MNGFPDYHYTIKVPPVPAMFLPSYLPGLNKVDSEKHHRCQPATEYDPNDLLFFGLVKGFETELGYFSWMNCRRFAALSACLWKETYTVLCSPEHGQERQRLLV